MFVEMSLSMIYYLIAIAIFGIPAMFVAIGRMASPRRRLEDHEANLREDLH